MTATTISIEFFGYWRDERKAALPEQSGVFCVYECTSNATENTVTIHKLIYIGEADNVKSRVINHEKYADWLKYVRAGNQLCFSFGGAEAMDRARAVAAMIVVHKPLANVEYVDAFPFDWITVFLSGATACLIESPFTKHAQDSPVKRLWNFYGQESILNDLLPRIEIARRRARPLEHLLLCGPQEMGKVTLAQNIARIMGVNTRVARGDTIGRTGDLVAMIANLKDQDILLIEDIDLLGRAIVEVLIDALDDYHLEFVVGKGSSVRNLQLTLPHFTLVGTTSNPSSVDRKLYRRFVIAYEFSPYKFIEIEHIVVYVCRNIFKVPLEFEALRLLASQCNGRASDAISLIKKIFTYGDVTANEGLTLSAVQDGLSKYGRTLSPEYLPVASNRERIPEEVRIAVWRRDGGKCARCGSRERLEYNHIVPVSKGGSNTARNIELLCESCNRKKSNNIE